LVVQGGEFCTAVHRYSDLVLAPVLIGLVLNLRRVLVETTNKTLNHHPI
jgi:hypothetical protein